MNVALVNLPATVQLTHEMHCVDCALYAEAGSAHRPDCALHAASENLASVNPRSMLDQLMERAPALPRGALLYHDSLPFNRIYVVRSGALKTVLISRGGKEQITGFCLPGDVLGLDSIGNACYRTSAVALESTAVCGVPYTSLRSMAGSIPGLQHYLVDLMSGALCNHHHALLVSGKSSAEERVAMFLVSLIRRYHSRRLSRERLRLPMTRCDIGNYLGLALETVSRVLTRFQQLAILRVQGRELHIIDSAYLTRIAQSME